MSRKHAKKARKKAIRRAIIIAILVIVLVLIGILIYFKVSESKYEKELQQSANNQNQQAIENQLQNEEIVNEGNTLSTLEIVNVDDMPDTIGGINVIGEIEIPKIDIKRYILDGFTMKAMDLTFTRFWGEAINEPGNFSIIGHNYKGMFQDLKELEIGDTFILTSNDGRTCTYVVYDIYIVEPDDVSCIEDTLEGQREVTLITCTPGGEKRLIVKAQEQK